MNRPRIGFTSTPLIFSLPSTTFPVCTAPKWSGSVNEVDSDCELSKCGVCQLAPVLSWLLHNPDRLPADWSPPVYRLAHLPGFQATRLPSSSPRVAADNLHCTPTLDVEPTGSGASNSGLLYLLYTCKDGTVFKNPKQKRRRVKVGILAVSPAQCLPPNSLVTQNGTLDSLGSKNFTQKEQNHH